eukprot:TRINITY_DN714_c0_g1_i1.p1 TRINITY_DN714_c0_g1~~TRINITY_DN714_c0_g1_i1.p1  ORF type:complete len:546 (-),score=117.52 TRINITY_DN714_c0_g1_i1:53-1690(-)
MEASATPTPTPAPTSTDSTPQAPTPSTLEDALKQLQDLQEENKRLRKQLKDDAQPTGRTLYSERLLLSDVIGRQDQGAGLVGKTISIAGWVRTIRLAAKDTLAFVHLNDGSTHRDIQIVVDQDREGFESLCGHGAKTGASVFARGRVVESKGKGQKIELLASKVVLVGSCDPLEYPIAKTQLSLEHLRTIAHLRPRTSTIASVARIRNALAFATHTFFQQKSFLYLHTPIITASDCEGAGEMFQITTLLNPKEGQTTTKTSDLPVKKDSTEIDFSEDFFERPAYLTVSGQLNGEQYACALSNIYTFGPTFRAENSFTARHLAEFWMIEPEMAFYDLEDNMDLAEAYLKFCIKYVMEHCPEDMAFFDKLENSKPSLLTRLKQVAETPFKRVTYTECIDRLEKSGHQFKEQPKWGIDMGTEHERYLTEVVFKMPIIVIDYPKSFKAFYMRLNEDGRTVRAMDVLVPKIGEIIGGSQREERLDVLLAMLKEKGLHEAAYEHYLDLRRFGTVPHSGFGLGFERLVMFATGIENIRDVIPFPRWPKHAQF